MTYTTHIEIRQEYCKLFLDYMFTFFEWHTQPLDCKEDSLEHCFWTICLLFLNDIHNQYELSFHTAPIVSGLYVYFFWMTYTTSRHMCQDWLKLFLDYMFTFFEWHTQPVYSEESETT